MAERSIDTEALVDLAVSLEEYERALAKLREDKAQTFKVVFKPVL
jgi:threonine dehydrogenase-like Zn-dependent dehydrogenase